MELQREGLSGRPSGSLRGPPDRPSPPTTGLRECYPCARFKCYPSARLFSGECVRGVLLDPDRAVDQGLSMRKVELDFAKTHLSSLIDEALSGDEVVIARHGTALVKLTPAAAPGKRRELGTWQGRVSAPDH